MKESFIKLLLFCLVSLNLQAQFATGEVNLGSNLTAEIQVNETQVTLTMTAPSDVWFAIGFNAVGMTPGTDAFIYNSTSNRDYTINGQFTPAADAAQNWNEVSNEVNASIRTVVYNRSLDSPDAADYDFMNASGNLNVVWAHSNSGQTSLAYHGSERGSTMVTFSEELSTNNLEKNTSGIAVFRDKDNNLKLTSGMDILNISLFDMNGKSIKQITSSTKEIVISTAHLSRGIYIVRVRLRNGEIKTAKFVQK